mmetsp:Transcript_21951/g.10327  ORF Transcript_21951/g.10327 Transcript_21951/m.10327 type:complete len:87 (-) Transcript_21951:1563-1823(-)
MFPSLMTPILWLSLIVDRRCATTSTVLPCETELMACCTSCSASLSKALVASSSSRTLGSRMMARAIAMRCFWPPLMRFPMAPTLVS